MGGGKHKSTPIYGSITVVLVVGLLLTVAVSCRSPSECDSTRRTDARLEPGWPSPNNFFTQVSYQEVKGEVPVVPGAEYVNDDEICATCHNAYAKTFAENVHRGDTCEACHGPASKHVEARGKEPGLIFSFKSGDPVARAEVCLRCHEENNCAEGTLWRRSKHANCKVTCVDCHQAHYNVPPGTPATTEPGETTMQQRPVKMRLASFELADGDKQNGQQYVRPAKNMPSLRGSSNHLGAVAPSVCYKCHCDMQAFQNIAGPHQICGPNGFNCTTCHDPHGQIKESSRKDLCLSCHTGAPTMAWHSSIHEHNGVACTDCHNPHPRTCVPQIVDIDHYQVTRAKRLMMSVQEPESCYKCHPRIYGLNALPYHHPIKEGKMVCSDCHDPHGQYLDNLKDETVNLVCYRCHAEKQGPFAFEHPPVTERCTICHEPHGTVARALLRKPVTFLCLQCHSGHATGTLGNPTTNTTNGTGGSAVVITAAAAQASYYTDCTHCHPQVHGSDRASATGHGYLNR